MENQNMRRMPSVEKAIAEIRPDDIRVAVTGTVIDFQEGFMVLDDGTGQASISVEDSKGVERGKLVRVLGRVIPTEGGFEIQAEVVQDMSGLDTELLKRVKSIIV